MDLVVGGGRDPLEDGVGIVVARLDAFEVEDRETAEAGELAGHAGIDDGVHRRGEDRDRQRRCRQNVWARSTSAGSIVSVPGASETSSKPYVGRMVSTLEWKTRRWAAAAIRDGRRRRPIDQCRPSCAASRWAACCRESTSDPGRRTVCVSGIDAAAAAVERQLEPGGPLRVGEVVADPLDRRRDSRARRPRGGAASIGSQRARVVLVRQGRLGVWHGRGPRRPPRSRPRRRDGSWNWLTRSRS